MTFYPNNVPERLTDEFQNKQFRGVGNMGQKDFDKMKKAKGNWAEILQYHSFCPCCSLPCSVESEGWEAPAPFTRHIQSLRWPLAQRSSHQGQRACWEGPIQYRPRLGKSLWPQHPSWFPSNREWSCGNCTATKGLFWQGDSKLSMWGRAPGSLNRSLSPSPLYDVTFSQLHTCRRVSRAFALHQQHITRLRGRIYPPTCSPASRLWTGTKQLDFSWESTRVPNMQLWGNVDCTRFVLWEFVSWLIPHFHRVHLEIICSYLSGINITKHVFTDLEICCLSSQELRWIYVFLYPLNTPLPVTKF